VGDSVEVVEGGWGRGAAFPGVGGDVAEGGKAGCATVGDERLPTVKS
jgi:hypothetical protein